jgi:hypothetical protein
METNDYGLAAMKDAWKAFQEARDKFEKDTYELRKRYVLFAFKNSVRGRSNDFKLTDTQHISVLNPEDFEDMLLFLDKDSIFGNEYHQVPVAYLADPDKWEADYFVQEAERKRVDTRRTVRNEMSRLQVARKKIVDTRNPEESLRNADLLSPDSLDSYLRLKDLLVKEVAEAGDREDIRIAVDMVSLTADIPQDYVHTALVLAEERKELFVRDTMVYTPAGIDLWFGDEDEDKGQDDYDKN